LSDRSSFIEFRLSSGSETFPVSSGVDLTMWF
jgi:hypothetical protein